MRLAKAVLVLGLSCVIVGAAAADKYEANEKDWSYGISDGLGTVAEQEPNDTCPGQQIACGDDVEPAALVPGDNDWYTFTAVAGTLITIGTDSYNGSTTDTYLELWSGDCASQLASNDDGGPGLFSLISNFVAPASGSYNIKVRGFSGSTQGEYKMFLRCVEPTPPPENDRCTDAYAIERCTSGTLEGDVTFARNDYNPGSGGCTGFSANGRDVAYRLDLVAGDVVDMTYTQLAFDTSFYIVTDCSNPAGTCVVGADATLSGEPEVINWVVPADGTYWLILDVFGTDTGGLWVLDWVITCEPTPVEDASWGEVKKNFR